MFQTTLTLTSASGTKYTKIYYYKRTHTNITLHYITYIYTHISITRTVKEEERERRKKPNSSSNNNKDDKIMRRRKREREQEHVKPLPLSCAYFCKTIIIIIVICFICTASGFLLDDRREIWGEWTRRRHTHKHTEREREWLLLQAESSCK